MPAVATVLASAANYMICDDHEFVDNLGECVIRSFFLCVFWLALRSLML